MQKTKTSEEDTMSKELHSYKVGQCLRFRIDDWTKKVIGTMDGKTLTQVVHERLTSLYEAVGIRFDDDPNAPSYKYLNIKMVTTNQLIGVDILTLREFGVEYRDEQWYELDLTNHRNEIFKKIDHAGFDEVVVLSHEDVCEIVNRQVQKLDKIACCAQEEAQRYRSKTETMCHSI